MWHILARYYRERRAFDTKARRRYVKRAIEVLKDRQAGTTLKWGVAHFLCTAEKYDGRRYTRFLRHQPSALLQGLIAPALPRTALAKDGVVQNFLARSAIEPGTGLAGPMSAAGVRLSAYGIKASALPRQVRHIFAALGLVQTRNSPLDIVGDVLGRRYNVVSGGHWRRLLGFEYAHAAGLLVQADSAFFSGPSYWLSHQNSFNQVVFLALQRHLSTTGGAGVVTTKSASGALVDYGVTLDKTNAFSKAHPTIATAFRDMNRRRNQLPGSHPYDKKSASQTKYLMPQERNRFVAQLKVAYAAVVGICP
jgi:hypothetical protein